VQRREAGVLEVNPVVYLDHNATTPVAAEVIAQMIEVMSQVWANPSSVHGPGQAARRLLADARARVARCIGCAGTELVFTSGATEANHMAVLGALAAQRGSGRSRIVMSAVEHAGLLALAQRMKAEGVAVDLIGVNAQGRPDLTQARRLIAPDVALVCLMAANNETGVCMPVAEVAALARAAGAWLHVDATQALGKSTLNFAASGAELMAVSAHKIGGPKGIGALVVKKGLALPPLLSGRQERHRRGGTENLPAIVGFAAACDAVAATLAHDLEHMHTLRERLQAGLCSALPEVQVFGAEAERLPNTLCLRFGELDAELVLSWLERAGVVAASGAACSAGGTKPSHVLLALGASAAQAKAGVRFSLGTRTTVEDIEFTLAATLRALGPRLAPAADPAVAIAA
jgi:cysteine desulfurase